MVNSGFSLLVVLFVVVVFVLALGGSYYSLQSRRRAWNELANRTGLTFEPGSFWRTPTVTGTYRGHALTLDTFIRGTGKSSTTYTRIVLFVNNQAHFYLAL